MMNALIFAVALAATAAEPEAQDVRREWVSFAERLARPILEPMSEGRLHAVLSRSAGTLEVSPKWSRRDDRVAYLEAFGRLVDGLAPWLALPDDGTDESRVRAELRTLVRKSCAQAVDPNSPDRLGWELGGQTLVDAAFLAEAFLRGWDVLWEPLHDVTKARYIAVYKGLRAITPPYQNWVLFASMCETFLMRAGAEPDVYRLRTGLYKAEEWYVGDGWYSDGPSFAFDYYNAFVIQPMYFECLDELVRAKKHWVPYVTSDGRRHDESDRLPQVRVRMQRHAVQLERMISPEGSFPVFGRSITYRMAVFQPLALLAWRHELPKELSPAQVRSALDAVRRRMFGDDRNFNAAGFLALGFNGSQPTVADPYTNGGSLYMTSVFLLPLGLPAEDPFWSDPPSVWTSKRAWSGESFPKDRKWNINREPLYWE